MAVETNIVKGTTAPFVSILAAHLSSALINASPEHCVDKAIVQVVEDDNSLNWWGFSETSTDAVSATVIQPLCKPGAGRWILLSTSGGGNSSAFSGLMPETPAGVVDGINSSFTLTAAPVGAVMVFLNGSGLKEGLDYIINGNVITFNTSPEVGSVLLTYYAVLNPGGGGGVTPASLANTLMNYVTSSALVTALAGYITSSALATMLASYATTSSLTTALANYVTNSALLDGYYFNSSETAGGINFPRWLGGFGMRWGSIACGAPTNVTFVKPFLTACLGITVTESSASGSWGSAHPTTHGTSDVTKDGYQGWAEIWNGSGWAGGTIGQRYIAIGY